MRPIRGWGGKRPATLFAATIGMWASAQGCPASAQSVPTLAPSATAPMSRSFVPSPSASAGGFGQAAQPSAATAAGPISYAIPVEPEVPVPSGRLGARVGMSETHRVTKRLGGGDDYVAADALLPADPRDRFESKVNSLTRPN